MRRDVDKRSMPQQTRVRASVRVSFRPVQRKVRAWLKGSFRCRRTRVAA